MKTAEFHDHIKGWLTPNSYGGDYSRPIEKSGLYMIVHAEIGMEGNSYRVLYVGMSKNIAKRLRAHGVLRTCRDRFNYVQVYFKEFRGDLRKAERKLIRFFNPPYNLQCRIKGA